MIARNDKTRRTLQVRVTDSEAEALEAAGFNIRTKPVWHDEKHPCVASMNAGERDALTLARGVFSGPVSVDHTRPAWAEAHAARWARVQKAPNPVAALLGTPEWKGSEVVHDKDERGRPYFYFKHKSGARAKIWAKSTDGGSL